MLLNDQPTNGRLPTADRPASPASRVQSPSALPMERSVYAPSVGGRVFGLTGTGALLAIILTGFFISIRNVAPAATPQALAVFDIKPPASPRETPPKKQEAPRPLEKKTTAADPAPIERDLPKIALQSPVTMPVPAATPKRADPAPREPDTAALQAAPAPPAPQMSGNGPDTWEGRVLTQLNRHRRYPRFAMTRRQQGVPYVRFVMDREGKVLSVRLERSSGFPELDREAVALPKRAQPLPKPPADNPGETFELVVPVEFFLRN